MQMSIANNISMAVPRSISRGGAINHKFEQAMASTFVSLLGIKTPSIHVTAASLSGGNQQKVALARWLATKPRVMILDEPTQGVDVGAKAEIHEIVTTMAENGVAIILISSELPEIVGMCDRVAVFHQQTISTILPRELITQENIMSLAFGHRLESSNIS
jgi:ABC-type sugar transport system ATPase subunit